jgi:hypothetical protein
MIFMAATITITMSAHMIPHLLLVDTTVLALVILIVKGAALHIQVAKAAVVKAVAEITAAPAQVSAA